MGHILPQKPRPFHTNSAVCKREARHGVCCSLNEPTLSTHETAILVAGDDPKLPTIARSSENGGNMCAQKVYVINEDPRQTATRKPETGLTSERQTAAVSEPPTVIAGEPPTSTPSPETQAPLPKKSNGWLLALRAYALGPVNLFLWPSGKHRKAWAIAGAASLAAMALLWIGWGSYSDVLQQLQFGAVIWVVSVALVILLTATAWSRVVATSERPVCWPRLLRRPGAVCAFGLIFPGLGLLIAGRRWKSAVAVWCAGLLVAAAVVVTHWRWLAANAVGAGGYLSHQTIEGIICVAAACAAFGFLAWLAFAFEGVRAVAPVTRSGSVANGLALALLVTLVAFLATVRPVPIARDLDLAAERLHHQGLRMIPLALYDVASLLDPGTPAYLAEAITICDELGLKTTADAKRDLLRKRAAQFADAIDAQLVPAGTREATLLWLNRPLYMLDPPQPNLRSMERADAGAPAEKR